MAGMDAVAKWIGENAAVIVALCALFVATYQAFATRRHNRLSVRPHVVVFANRESSNGQGVFAAQLRNSGLGPAVVKRYLALLDGEPIALRDSAVITNTVATIIGRAPIQVGYYRLIKGDAIAKDQEATLLKVVFPCASHEDYQIVMRSFERLSVRIEYTSIYGEEYLYDSQVIGT